MVNQPAFKTGDRVVKNPESWDSLELDARGVGRGVGIVADLLIEFDDGDTVNVRWPTCRFFQKPKELLLAEHR